MPAVVAQPFAGRRSLAGLLRTSSPSTFIDPKLWNLVAFAERLGVLAELALRLTVNAFQASRTAAPAAHGGRPVSY